MIDLTVETVEVLVPRPPQAEARIDHPATALPVLVVPSAPVAAPASTGGAGAQTRTGQLVEPADGVRRTFALPAPYLPDSVLLHLNGLALLPDVDYSEVPGGVLLAEAPLTGDVLTVMFSTTT